MQRGFPLFITASQNLANAFAGSSRPNENGQDPNLDGGSAVSRLAKWFNTANFSQPAPFTVPSITLASNHHRALPRRTPPRAQTSW